MDHARRNSKLWLVLAAWLALLGAGFGKLFIYANTPGESSRPASGRWPAETRLTRDPKTATLVVFAHPRCPCSVATVGELERLMPHIREKVKTIVAFYQPKERSRAWVEAGLWKKAESIPDTEVVADEDEPKRTDSARKHRARFSFTRLKGRWCLKAESRLSGVIWAITWGGTRFWPSWTREMCSSDQPGFRARLCSGARSKSLRER